jgi:ferredoxin
VSARVIFQPGGVAIDCRDGESLFDAAGRQRISVDTACVGKGTCGLCRVRVLAGEEFLSPYTEEETKHLGNVYFLTKVRLSCRARISGGEVTVELAPKKQRERPGPDSKPAPPPRNRGGSGRT